MQGWKQQASALVVGADAATLLSAYLPTSQGTYPNPGQAQFIFRNEGTVSAYVVTGAETESATEIPADDIPREAGPFDWDSVPKLYQAVGADVWITTYVRGAR